MLRNSFLSYFESFLIVLLALFFITKPDYLRDLSIFMMLFISLFEYFNVVLSELKMFQLISANATDVAAAHPSDIKTILVNDISIFFH